MEDNSQQNDVAQLPLRISEAAHTNHEEWFPGNKSTLKSSDPDLIEVFDNVAFDEVMTYGELNTKNRVMVTLASIIDDRDVIDYGTTQKGETFKNAAATVSRKSVADLVLKLAVTPGLENRHSLGIHSKF